LFLPAKELARGMKSVELFYSTTKAGLSCGHPMFRLKRVTFQEHQGF